MIVGNLYFIKSTSGLFHYGVDYLRACDGLIRKLLVRPELLHASKAAFPNHQVVACTAPQMLWQAVNAARRGDVFYTPTPHPLPGLSSQWIVLHDAYPFVVGWKSGVKKAMLRLSLATSKCRVAHINQSEALTFVRSLRVSADRLVFAPNQFPSVRHPSLRKRCLPAQLLVVALVGTESAKKNYAALFDAVIRLGGSARLKFHIYGHYNAYVRQLQAQFPTIQLEVFPSDSYSLDAFFSKVQVLVSVARQEGFGRPVAGALLAGVPCLLTSCPVFHEFFDPGAMFYSDEMALVNALLVHLGEGTLVAPNYTPPALAVKAFNNAVKTLQGAGSACSEAIL